MEPRGTCAFTYACACSCSQARGSQKRRWTRRLLRGGAKKAPAPASAVETKSNPAADRKAAAQAKKEEAAAAAAAKKEAAARAKAEADAAAKAGLGHKPRLEPRRKPGSRLLPLPSQGCCCCFKEVVCGCEC